MRIAYVSLAPFISGAERALQLILTQAPDHGIEPLVICPPGSPFHAWCEAHSVPHVAIRLAERDKRHPIRWFASVARVVAALRRHRIDVVHSNQVWAFAAAGTAARVLGLPTVCHMRDEVGVDAVRWWCRSGVDAVVCISAHIERMMSPAWAGARRPPIITTLHDPVVVPPSSEVESGTSRLADRARFGIDSSGVIFGFIGQITAVKGVKELLEACGGLTSQPGWSLVIAGRDPQEGRPYETECRQWVAEHGLDDRIRFVGFLEDVSAFYRAIDVAVVPSLKEPLGLIPLEAGAAGRPAIAFASGGLAETIVDGETGWLVPTGDIVSLRRVLAAVLLEPSVLRLRGRAARDRVAAKYTPGEHMRALTRLYEGARRAQGKQA